MPFSHFLSNSPVLLPVTLCFNLIYPMPVDTVYLIYKYVVPFKAIFSNCVMHFFKKFFLN